MNNTNVKRIAKAAGLVFAGFLMGRGCQEGSEVNALTEYDMNGDGIKDAIVSVGSADVGRTRHPGFNIGYIDGKNIQTITETRKDYFGRTNSVSKRIAKGGLTLLNANMFSPGIAENDPNYFTGRYYEIQPSTDGKTLDLVVSDGTTDSLIFSKTNNTYLPNPNFVSNGEKN